jgi:surface antigen
MPPSATPSPVGATAGLSYAPLPPEAAEAAAGGYPWAKAVCEYGARGGADCSDPRNAGDAYNWGYWHGKQFDAADKWGYEYRNCTSYVAWRLSRAGVNAGLFADLGNASAWIGNVAGEPGVTVNHTASPGAIATWVSSGVGHVAWVDSVRGGHITVSDFNYDGTGVYGKHALGSTPTGYIHFP